MRVQITARRRIAFAVSIPDSPVEFRPHALEGVFVCPAPRSTEIVAIPQQKVGKGGSHFDVGGQ